MLSDEEKYAIDYLKIYIERDVMYENRHYKQIEIILNLIEKQSKEIEELKQTTFKRSDMCFLLKSENTKLKAEIKALENADLTTVYLNGVYDGEKKSKDKIKAKIEELKAIADNGANAVRFAMTHEDEIERIQKQKDIGTMVEILQSLLEKE